MGFSSGLVQWYTFISMGTPPFLPILSFLEYAVDKLFVSHDFPKKIPFLFFIKKSFPYNRSCKEACPFYGTITIEFPYCSPTASAAPDSRPRRSKGIPTGKYSRKRLRAGIFNHNRRKAIARKTSGAAVCPSITVPINFHAFISIPDIRTGKPRISFPDNANHPLCLVNLLSFYYMPFLDKE